MRQTIRPAMGAGEKPGSTGRVLALPQTPGGFGQVVHCTALMQWAEKPLCFGPKKSLCRGEKQVQV